MTKLCETCGKEFSITKYQTTKKYCSAQCSGGYYQTANAKRNKKKK